MDNKKTVFVGVSGGVDSSVSLALLKDQGYSVVGVFIKTWQPEWIEPTRLNSPRQNDRVGLGSGGCTWRKEKQDAMRVCAHLDVPFLFFDFEEEYKKGVADYMINEYKMGRTPNPDVMCNREIKFGAFFDKAMSMGADYVATGHYARIQDDALCMAKDENKDQSYFLWTIKKEQLNKILFPIGHLEKREVRRLAEKYGLLTATKKDSQGICFIGEINMKEFLTHYIPIEKGNVLNEKGDIVGVHNGSLFYTLGERHGFTITKKGNNDKPVYVISKNVDDNTITIGEENVIYRIDEKKGMDIKLIEVNIISKIKMGGIKFRNRYRQELRDATFNGVDTVSIDFVDRSLSVGQSIVIYENERVVGGGTIDKIVFV